MLDPLNIKEQNLILIPVSNLNGQDVNQDFYYYDSLNPLNFEESKKLAKKKLLIYLGISYHFHFALLL